MRLSDKINSAIGSNNYSRKVPSITGDPRIIQMLNNTSLREAEAMRISQAQAQAAENSAAAEIVPAPGSDAAQAQAQPVYYYTPTTVKPRFGLCHIFLLVGSVYLIKKIFKV